MGAGPTPDDLAEEILASEDRVEQELQVVAGRGIAMQVE
jgi:hypothetical protein